MATLKVEKTFETSLQGSIFVKFSDGAEMEVNTDFTPKHIIHVTKGNRNLTSERLTKKYIVALAEFKAGAGVEVTTHNAGEIEYQVLKSRHVCEGFEEIEAITFAGYTFEVGAQLHELSNAIVTHISADNDILKGIAIGFSFPALEGTYQDNDFTLTFIDNEIGVQDYGYWVISSPKEFATNELEGFMRYNSELFNVMCEAGETCPYNSTAGVENDDDDFFIDELLTLE